MSGDRRPEQAQGETLESVFVTIDEPGLNLEQLRGQYPEITRGCETLPALEDFRDRYVTLVPRGGEPS